MLSSTANARLLKKAVRASNASLNETRIRISEEGIAIRAVDTGNIFDSFGIATSSVRA